MDRKQLQENVLQAAYNPERWINVLRDCFNVKRILQNPTPVNLPNQEIAESAVELGSFETADERLVGIYEVRLTSKPWIEINRVGLRNLLRSVYRYDVDAALIVFSQGDKWRFSYVSEILAENGKKETEPKRYTYLFGKGETCRTAADRFENLKGKPITLDDLFEAFSVEKLNKEFFDKYKKHFETFWKFLAENKRYYALLHDKEKEDRDKKTKPIRDFVKVLLGRLVFLQFLQKKGWMGVPASRPDYKGGDVKFVQNLFARFTDQNHFHSMALRTLFFETLNKKRPNDLAPEILGKNIKIPYLNGGLFDGDISAEHAIDFPSEYFRDLLDFFEQYNFTIDESDAFDREVGIDPEMLGHIFENLLEENREKGAFYTPKEIVHYMCQESLIEYLSTNLSADDKADIELLVRHNIVSESIQNNRKRAVAINDLLKAVKICDPAIGSGAFPMGLLKEIFECRRLLFAPTKSENFNAAQIKKEIIQNNIYGVDIEPGAVDIARLRFWLSLVVDEEDPQPLPNLDFKIMQGNSVLERFDDIDLSRLVSADSDDETNDLMIIEQRQLGFGEGLARVEQPQLTLTTFDLATKEKLQKLIEIYFDPEAWEQKTGEKFDKFALKNQINDMVEGKIHAHIFAEKKRLEAEVEKYEKKWIGAGFSDFSLLSQSSKEFKTYLAFKRQFERAGETEQRLIELQETTDRPYFLWHLWFKDVFDEKGFDIFIGNPPYIKEYTDRSAFDGLHQSKYYQGKMDIWYFFACYCLDLLKPNGIECLIAQNNWITSAGASILRDKILRETTIKLFTDFGDYKVFQSAGIQTMIYLLRKSKPNSEYQTNYRRLNRSYIEEAALANFLDGTNTERNEDFYKFVHTTIPINYLDGSIYFNEPETTELIQLILDNEKITNLYDFEVAQGIVPPQDKLNAKNQKKLGSNFEVGEGIFQITTSEIDALNLSEDELEIIKPFYSTKQLNKYYADTNTDEWIIYTKSDAHRTIKNYPNIKRHLDRFKKVITSDFAPYGLHRARDENFFIGEKIMSLRKTEHPNFTFTDFDCYVSQTYFIIKTDRINLKYLTTVLNSKLTHFWLKNRGKMQGNLLQVDKEPLLKIPIKDNSDTGKFQILFDYLRFLNDKNNKPVNQFTNNLSIAAVFEDVLNMMVYELYFEEHMKENKIDVLKFIDISNIYRDISDLRETEQKEIIGAAYSWLQQSGNPIRDRITLANIRSKDIIRKINSSTH